MTTDQKKIDCFDIPELEQTRSPIVIFSDAVCYGEVLDMQRVIDEDNKQKN